jgi:hypothetical protein
MDCAVASGVVVGTPPPKIRVTLLLPEFVTQTVPALSTATELGVLKPPPVKPVEGESGTPLLLSQVTLPLLLDTQTELVPSIAIPVELLPEAPRPPPV